MKTLPAVTTRGHPSPRDGLDQRDTPTPQVKIDASVPRHIPSILGQKMTALGVVGQTYLGRSHDPWKSLWPLAEAQVVTLTATHNRGQGTSLSGPVHRVE